MYRKNNYSSRPKTQQGRLGRRWYVDAAIPKAVPFIGGASFKAGSGTLSKRSLQQMIRQTSSVDKQKVFSDVLVTANHNTLYTWNPLSNIAIGTGELARLGQSIHVDTIKVKGQITNFSQVNKDHDIVVRLMWVKHTAQYGTGSNAFVSGLGSSQIFVDGSSTMTNAIVDKTRCTKLKEERIVLSPNYHTAASQHYRYIPFEFDCPLPKDGINFTYNTVTSNYGKTNNYYLIATATQILDGVSGTTVCANIEFDSQVQFSDT